MVKILIVDDHEIFREGLKQVINQTDDFTVKDEACNGREALNLIWKNDYDIVILDISMPPGRNGLEVLKQMKIKKPDLRVLILSVYPEDQYAIQAIKAGASGYLTKSSVARELINALTRISSNGMYISPEVAEQMADEIKAPRESIIHDLLSPREFQIFLKIAGGESIKQIADELAISSSSVSTHRKRILDKMKLKNTAEMIRYAVKNRLVE
jgi:two-component system invasion response regulator UvrY